MQYYGGKSRIKKYLHEILNKLAKDKVFVDLFCGACNVVEGITTAKERMANDINPYLIALLKDVQAGYIPPEKVTQEMYYKAMVYDKDYPEALVGFLLIGCTCGGGWRSGFAHNSNHRNYALNAKRTLMKQKHKLKGVKFSCMDFQKLKIPDGAVVYCDPPYKGTALKYYKNKFDYEAFERWVEENKHRLTIVISEYEQNENKNYKTIWRKPSKVNMDNLNGSRKNTVEILQIAT